MKQITNKSFQTRIMNQLIAKLKDRLSIYGDEFMVEKDPIQGDFKKIVVTNETWHFLTMPVIKTLNETIEDYREKYQVFAIMSARNYFTEELHLPVSQPAFEVIIPLYEE